MPDPVLAVLALLVGNVIGAGVGFAIGRNYGKRKARRDEIRWLTSAQQAARQARTATRP